MKNQLVDLIRDRHSARVYTQESLSLEQLSFLLWATQGSQSPAGGRPMPPCAQYPAVARGMNLRRIY